tara:strand:- start:549 stop:3071 length:2523 start_codon:yes stop_codon:yes gene_type:complete
VVASSGSGSTGDNADDIVVAQNFVITDYGAGFNGEGGSTGAYASRARSLTTSRLLPSGSFDYGSAGLASLPKFGNSDISYAVSTGLSVLNGFNDIRDFIDVRITPDTITPGVGLDPPVSITFGGVTFTDTQGLGLGYEDSQGRTIRRDQFGSTEVYMIDLEVPDKSRYLESNVLVLGATIGLDFFSSFSDGQAYLPFNALGADGQIIRTSNLPSQVAANAFNSFDENDYSDFFANKNYTTFEGVENSLTDYLDSIITVDIVDADSGNGFSRTGTHSSVTLRSGFGGTGAENELGGRALDNFLFAQIFDQAGRSILFATGDVGKTRTGGATIDTFGLSRGLSPQDAVQLTGQPTSTLNFRAFLPQNSAGDVPIVNIVQTNVLVANPASGGNLSTSRLFHADLGTSANGTSVSVSATFGTLVYDNAGYPDRIPTYQDDSYSGPDDDIPPDNLAINVSDPRAKVTLEGTTIGSSQPTSGASTLFAGPLTATAIGGGRDWQPGNGTQLRSGYAGYLVLEGAANSSSSLVTGKASQLGASSSDEYGYLRLAAGYSSQSDADTVNGASSAIFQGYVAGAIEKVGTTGSVTVQPYLGTISDLTLNPVANTVAASISYNDGSARTMNFGSGSDLSTFIKDGAYGAASTTGGGNAALIAGDAVKAGLGTQGAAIGSYQHLQWGFFFGDVLPSDPSGAERRNHSALSTWVAGKRFTGNNADVGADSSIRGSVSFSGHAIGTVLSDPSASAAVKVGSFTQQWDLNARTGTMDLAFDARAFQAIPLAVSGTTGLAYGGTSLLVDSRQAKVSGELVDVPTARALPGATIGEFQVRSVDGTYQANGTFGGDRAQ